MAAKYTTLATAYFPQQPGLPSTRFAMDEAFLVVGEGPHKGERLALDREVMQLGRGAWCDLVLQDDAKASKEHCELRLTPEGILVRDLDSRNGVLINDVQIKEAYLMPGATLRLGDTRLELQTTPSRREIEVSSLDQSSQMVGQNPAMRKIFSMLSRLAARDLPVCLTGETGTGKTTLARALHDQSHRASGPFVTVNCGAISATLTESLFFGYEKGAFTGADKAHKGYFEQAHHGTLFLDELGEFPLELQPKLLDVIESGRIKRLGSEKEIEVDVRIVSSTHRDLHHEIEQGNFRQDLYFRLVVADIEIPPLRQRPEDIPLLVQWLLSRLDCSRELIFTPASIQALQNYLWPGNIRQLRNVLERLVAFVDIPDEEDTLYIQPEDLFLPPLPSSPTDDDNATPSSPPTPQGSFDSLKALIEATEKQAIEQTLASTRWNVSEASRRLQITTAWLYKRLKKYGLSRPE